ncbi:MAG: S41 family peptidase [Planctomycetota bacterium]
MAWLFVLVVALLAAAPAPPPVPAKPDPAEAVKAAAARMEKAGAGSLWAEAASLARSIPDGRDAVRAALPGAGLRARVGLSCVLSTLGDKALAGATLAQVAGSAEAPEDLRILAAEALGRTGSAGGSAALRAFAPELPARVRLALAESVWETLREERAREALRTLSKDADPSLSSDASLALARCDGIEEVRPRLEALRDEPGARGREAALLLEALRLQARLDDRLPGGVADGPRLVDEVVDRVRENYVDESRIEPSRLAVAGARGVAESLDPFSSFLDEAEWKRFREQLEGQYAGIGAYIGARFEGTARIFVVISPIYSGPAYAAGIRSLDRILEVNGMSVRGKTVDEVSRMLRGPEGTEVALKIFRLGWQAPETMRIKRSKVQVDSVLSGMLPGRIGYVRVLSFGQETAEALEKALVALESKEMRGLLLDLRDNPGGLLEGGVRVAEKFLGAGKLVVYSQGRAGPYAARDNHFTREGKKHPDYPMIVLVNRGSASASEIVAGALRDHARATLVGDRTYGKGSVQRLLSLPRPFQDMRLRLTVAKYYLPSDRCIHEIGIEPDLYARAEKVVLSRFEAREALRESELVEQWLARRVSEDLKGLLALAENDGFDPARWPGLEELRKDPKVKGLSADDVRRILRSFARKRAEDERGAIFAFDLGEDRVLQRSALEMAKKLGEDPEKSPDYAPVAARLKATEADLEGADGVPPPPERKGDPR